MVIRGLLTGTEWAVFEPFVVQAGPLRGRPPRDHRRMLRLRERLANEATRPFSIAFDRSRSETYG